MEYIPIEERLSRIEELLQKIMEIIKQPNINVINDTQQQKEIMKLSDVAEMLGLSKQTLYGKTSRREIPHYKLGKSIYFKRDEVMAWALKNKQLTMEEIEREADSYIVRNPNPYRRKRR